MNKYEEIQKRINSLGEHKCKILLRSRYTGKGRPKKSDYVVCKVKEIIDIQMFDTLNGAFNTSYTK